MKNPSKIIVSISTIACNTIAILASSSRLLHFKPEIVMIVRVCDWHVWPQRKIIRLNVLRWKRGFTQTIACKQRPTSVYLAYPTGIFIFPASKTLPMILLCHLWSLIQDSEIWCEIIHFDSFWTAAWTELWRFSSVVRNSLSKIQGVQRCIR